MLRSKKSILYVLALVGAILIVLFIKDKVIADKSTLEKIDIKKVAEDFELYDNLKADWSGFSYKNKYGEATFDKNGKLIELDQLDAMSLNKKSEKFKSVEDIKKMLLDEGYVDSSYEIYKEGPFLDEGLDIWYVKKSKYGLKNMYNSIRVLVDTNLNLPVSYKKIEEFTDDIEPKISQDEAVEIAAKFLKENIKDKEYKLRLVELSVKERNDYYKLGDVKDKGKLSIVYNVEFEIECVYVDILTGDIVGGTVYETKAE